jgi:polyadenylate-binding protein
MKVQDKDIQVAIHNKRVEKEEDNFTNLHVMNIPEDYTEAQLKELFSKFGEITSVKKKDDKSG